MKCIVLGVSILAVMVGLLAGPSNAARIELGVATGGIGVYYNNLDVNGAGGVPDGVVSGYDENPSNQAYIQAQHSYSNTDGMAFQFNDTIDLGGGLTWNTIFSGQPVGSSQFGFDLLGIAATYSALGGVSIPQFDFVDYDFTGSGANNTHTTVIPNGNQAWAINDYKGGSGSGPGNGGTPVNSVLRGSALTFNITNFAVAGTLYTIDVEGTLLTDGLIHWFSNIPDTDLTTWGLRDTLHFHGTLVYNLDYRSAGLEDGTNTYANGFENGSDQLDFYGGTLVLEVETVPEPTTMALLTAGIAAMAGRRRGII